MSIFKSMQLSCPVCRTSFAYEAVHSVNADRRPDLREAILDGSFQKVACPKCEAGFRLDPSFNYLDVGKGLWIAAEAVTGLADWKQREDNARELFDRAYGSGASALAREIGAGMRTRVTFGWPALREKILIVEHGLDDVAIEACKATAMRAQAELPLSGDADLRFVDLKDDRLVFAWVNPADNEAAGMLGVARSLHDEIAADEAGDWFAFKQDYEGAFFVDLDRMLITQPA